MKKSYHSSAEPTAAASMTCRSCRDETAAGEPGLPCAMSSFLPVVSPSPLAEAPGSSSPAELLSRLADLEVAVPGGRLVLVDRALMRRRRQRHAHRHRGEARHD